MKINTFIVLLLLILSGDILLTKTNYAQEAPGFLYDRGTGMPISIFGTYIEKGELLIYPFYEYYLDRNLEYEPYDFGLRSKKEYRGRYEANEGLILIGYGISDRLAIEFEAGIISANFNKSEKDTSTLAKEIKESGLSDVEGQVRWRWNHENLNTPEFFNYFEFVFPTGKKYSLIGTSDWEFKLGTGLIKGFNWGTLTFRFAIDYTAAEKKVEMGEYAFEYLKRISHNFRLFFMLEGSEDEVVIVPEIHWFIAPGILLKVNTGFGITSKATDFAPEIGLMLSLFP